MDPCFSTSIYDPHTSHLGHKSMGKKNSVHNLQHGPQTWLARGIYTDWLEETYISTRAGKKIEIQLLSGPVHFSFQLPQLKVYVLAQ